MSDTVVTSRAVHGSELLGRPISDAGGVRGIATAVLLAVALGGLLVNLTGKLQRDSLKKHVGI